MSKCSEGRQSPSPQCSWHSPIDCHLAYKQGQCETEKHELENEEEERTKEEGGMRYVGVWLVREMKMSQSAKETLSARQLTAKSEQADAAVNRKY